MAVLNVIREKDKLDRGKDSAKAERRYVVEFDYATNSSAAGCVSATDGTDAVPGPTSTYSFVTEASQTINMYCSSWKAEAADSPTVYTVDVTWESDAGEAMSGSTSSSFYGIDVKFGSERSTQPAYYDRNNKPIRNSAGELFEEQPEMEIHDGKLTLSYSMASASANAMEANIETKIGRVNSASCSFSWGGVTKNYDAGTLKLEDANREYDAAANAWKVTLEFGIRLDGWGTNIEDQGFNKLVAGQLVPIMTGTNSGATPVTKAAKLNGSGGEWTGAATGGAFLTFYIPKTTTFAELFNGILL